MWGQNLTFLLLPISDAYKAAFPQALYWCWCERRLATLSTTLTTRLPNTRRVFVPKASWNKNKSIISKYTLCQGSSGLALTSSTDWPASSLTSCGSPWPTLMGRSMLLFTTSLRWEKKLFNCIGIKAWYPYCVNLLFWCEISGVIKRISPSQ